VPKSVPQNELVAKHVHTYPRNVPQERYFYGREAILQAVRDQLDSKKSNRSGPRCLALYGEPAVGKTSLVKRFVQSVDTKKEYDYVLFMTAESETNCLKISSALDGS
jgi:Cdc6-like AAA superfamily ATPase